MRDLTRESLKGEFLGCIVVYRCMLVSDGEC